MSIEMIKENTFSTIETQKVLQDCDAGCKMALISIKQIEDDITDTGLIESIQKAKKQHEEIQRDTEKLLDKYEMPTKDANPMATVYSWITTEMKLMFKDNNKEVAKIMMDGCNMGVQKTMENLNKYKNISDESKKQLEKLVKAEEDFAKDMEKFV